MDPDGDPPVLYRRVAGEDGAETFAPVANFDSREEALRFYAWLGRLLPRVS